MKNIRKTIRRLIIIICLISLFTNYYQYYKFKNTQKDIFAKEKYLDNKIDKYNDLLNEQSSLINKINQYTNNSKIFSKKLNDSAIFKISAYDLSIRSCNKTVRNKDYGISRGGVDLRGHNWKTIRAIATDPKIISLGKLVYIKFLNPDYDIYTGIYQAVDVGNAIKGNKIDLFLGDFKDEKSSEAFKFGITFAKVVILN